MTIRTSLDDDTISRHCWGQYCLSEFRPLKRETKLRRPSRTTGIAFQQPDSVEEEVLRMLSHVQTGMSPPATLSLSGLSNTPDKSQNAIRMLDLNMRLCKEAARSLKVDGRLLLFKQGWYPLGKHVLQKAGFDGIDAYRTVGRGNYVVALKGSKSPTLFLVERIFRCPPFVFLLKMFPGKFFYSATLEGAGMPELFIKLNHRTLFCSVTDQDGSGSSLFIKASRPMARGDFPLKEKFIMDWIRGEKGNIDLPDIRFESTYASILQMSHCPGTPLRFSTDSLLRPDNTIRQTITKVRQMIERLSTIESPEPEKCRSFLDMVSNEVISVREEIYKDVSLGSRKVIVHGDLNPENLIINSDKVFVIDWEHWRLGKVFENWFDFIIRAIWMTIPKRKRSRAGFIIRVFQRALRSHWVKEETTLHFQEMRIEAIPVECLRYCLFLFLVDGVMKEKPEILRRDLEQISMCQ